MWWDIVEKISVILGLLSLLPCVSFIFTFARRKNAERKKRMAIEKGAGSASAVLFVTIGQESIESAVKKHIDGNASLKEELKICSFEELTEANFFCILKEEKLDFHNPTAAEQYETDIQNQLQAVSGSLKSIGITRVHLFYCGLYTFAAMIGAELSNRCTVVAYHYTPGGGGSYHCVGTLQ